MNITFLGAAGEVTGSQHLIETRDRRILLDCGLFQGPRAEARRKNEIFHCQPKKLDAVILSHAHIDHCGNLPRLYAQGFRGPVFCSDATADIAEVMLLDSARIQEEDASYLSRKLRGEHPSVEPLYTVEDVEAVIKRFEPCTFSEWHPLTDDGEVRIRFTPSGHILGAAITELDILAGTDRKRIVYTGDLGRRRMPLLKDPTPVTDGADAVICESTYGNRVHTPPQDIKEHLLRIITTAESRGGRVIIPAFSLGRTQQVVYYLNELFNSGMLPRIPIFVDSPLSTRITHIFRRYDHTLDADVQAILKFDDDVFGFEHLTYVASRKESMELNDRDGPFVVIASSGMCENGRVVHHLKHAIGDERNTIVLIGYQAPHTTGRHLADRRKYIKLFGRDHALKADVVDLEGLSAHADVTDLKWWFEESARHGHFGQVFLVHGEPDSSAALAEVIRDNCDEDPIIPQWRESYEV